MTKKHSDKPTGKKSAAESNGSNKNQRAAVVTAVVGNDLPGDCAEVLKTLAFKEYKVGKKTPAQATYLLRIIPYRAANNVIDGLVLTFVNIGHLKQHEVIDQ